MTQGQRHPIPLRAAALAPETGARDDEPRDPARGDGHATGPARSGLPPDRPPTPERETIDDADVQRVARRNLKPLSSGRTDDRRVGTQAHAAIEPAHLRIRTRRTPDATVVDLTGEVDLAVTGMLDALLRQEATRPDRRPRIFVDLSKVTFIDASGLGMPLRAQDHARAHGTDLIVCRPHRSVRRLLDLTGLAGRLCPA